MEHERWVSVDAVAEHLGVTRESIYRWMSKKGLPSHQVGRMWRFQLSEIDEWVKSGKAASDEDELEGDKPC